MGLIKNISSKLQASRIFFCLTVTFDVFNSVLHKTSFWVWATKKLSTSWENGNSDISTAIYRVWSFWSTTTHLRNKSMLANIRQIFIFFLLKHRTQEKLLFAPSTPTQTARWATQHNARSHCLLTPQRNRCSRSCQMNEYNRKFNFLLGGSHHRSHVVWKKGGITLYKFMSLIYLPGTQWLIFSEYCSDGLLFIANITLGSSLSLGWGHFSI